MNEIAKAHWDLAMAWIEHADSSDDINVKICYASMAEFALKAAQFAVDHPALVMGVDEFAPPGPNSPAPVGPTQGPRFWGAPGP